MNEKLKYLGKNTILFAISSFGTRFISFFLVPLYTSILTTAEYGTADLLTTTGTLLIYVLTLDIPEAVIRYALDSQNKFEKGEKSKQQKNKEQQDILSYGNRVTIISTLICCLGLGIVYFLHILNWPFYYYIFILLYFFSTSFYQLLTNYLRGVDKVASFAIAGIVSALVTILFNILFIVVFRFGLTGYLAAMVLGPLAGTLYCTFSAGAPLKTYIFDSCSKELKDEMLKYCVPLIFNNIALWINGSLDRYFVTAICGASENGIYSIAYKIPSILATCYSVFGQAWNLSAIKEYDPEDKDGFFAKMYEAFNSFMTMVCSFLILLNIPLSKFLYSKDFFIAWRCSSVLLLYVMFNSLTMFIGGVFGAVKESKAVASTTILSAVCNTILNSVMIPLWGALGAAIATVIAYIIMWAVRMKMVRKYIKFKVNLKTDVLVYLTLVLQIVFEHLTGHFYIGQLCCFALILFIYRKEIKILIQKIIFNRIK